MYEDGKPHEPEFIINRGRIGVVHVADEVALLRDAARRIAWEGETYADVINDWHSRTPPVLGATGAPWNTKTLEYLMTAPRMVAKQEFREVDQETEAVVSTRLVDAKWEPVLEEATWRRLCAKRKRAGEYSPRRKYPLTGLAVCGRCDGPLTGSTRKKNYVGVGVVSVRTYRCNSGTAYKARGSCGKLAVNADDVERLVIARVLLRLKQTRGVASGLSADEVDLHRAMEEAAAEIAACEDELEELAALKADKAARLSVREWMAARVPVMERQDEARDRLEALTRSVALPVPAGKDYEDLLSWFEALSPGQQGKLLAANVVRVTVLATGRSGPRFNPERVVVALPGAE